MRPAFRAGGSALLLAAIAAACSSDPTIPDDTSAKAQLTVVHASPALGPVNVRVADLSVVTGLAYGRSSGAVLVPAGDRLITVMAGDSALAEFSTTLTAGEGTAVTIGEDTTQMSPVTPDTGTVVSNRANVRLVNVVGATTADPTLLTMRLNFPGVAADSTALIGLDAKVASHGPLMYFDPGHFRVAFVAQGSTTVLTGVEFDVVAGETAIIVLERNASGAYAVRIVKEP